MCEWTTQHAAPQELYCLDEPINMPRLRRCGWISIERTSQNSFDGRVLCQLLSATHSLRARESETACTTRM